MRQTDKPAPAIVDGRVLGSTWSGELRLVTAMCGGGVQGGKVNERRPVREEGVRGQLRRFWRMGVCRASSLEERADAEAQIFGDTRRPSALAVRLRDVRMSRLASAHEIPAGASGPLRANATWALGVRARLVLTGPEKAVQQGRAALRLWSLFGGYGARTRRGAGSLAPVEPPELPVHELVREMAKRVSSTRKPPNLDRRVQTLWRATRVWLGPRHDSALAAWTEVADDLKAYRQQRNGERGRTYWPEPDSIRTLTGNPRHPQAHPLTGQWPRALLGLPLQFHSPGGGAVKGQLTWRGGDRWPSPVWLKVLEAEGAYHALVTCFTDLALPEDSSLVFERRKTKDSLEAWATAGSLDAHAEEARGQGRVDPMGGARNAIEGFEVRLASAAWTKVVG